MSKLANKVAVVTGAAKGIGAGIAKALAAEGAAVVVNYAASKAGAERVVSEITAAGGKAVAIQADVSKPDDIARLFAQTQAAFGTLDVLVNNAGVYQMAPLEQVSAAEFHRQFDTNVLGVLLASQEALKHFGPAGGSIVNIGSVITNLGMPTSSVYTGTKAAVKAITEVLAKELAARHIRVNTISPGMVETEGTHAAGIVGSEMETQVVATTPLGRMGQPSDIAPVAVFLASDDARWITGETLIVSGGVR
ncbi:glucose 1-dehydrogenase [Azorhizobium sp. AG788]|uniref:glucose 1-dehydrogenase n=1 Tax=Azorhizobium sp. AG788 TaxID=2183897 RepID=UPI0031388B8D